MTACGCGCDGVESLPPAASSPPQADRQAASSAIAARREAKKAEVMKEGTAHVESATRRLPVGNRYREKVREW